MVKPRKLLRHRRRIIAAPGAPKSMDEQIAELFDEILEAVNDLPDPNLQELWGDAISDFVRHGDVTSLTKATMWRRPVVPLDEFLFGKGYLGTQVLESDVYPGVLEALRAIDTDQYDEIVEKGAIGIGKSFLANLGMARDLYKLSCMRSPQSVYGIATGSPIVFTVQSVRLGTAKKVIFGELGRFIRYSPYFKQKFMFDPLISSEMIFREHNISIMPVSSATTAAISMNVIGGQLDEMNFMQKTLKSRSSEADEKGEFDQAKKLYNTLASRRRSRFTRRGDLPGALYLISSSRFPDDFTELKARESVQYGGEDDRIYVFEGSQWSVKGRGRFMEEEFTVQIGNEKYPSKVLARDADTQEDLEEVSPGCESIRVPMDFYKEFKNDVEMELRNTAGITTLSTRPFITQREKIGEAFERGKENGYINPISGQLEECEFSIGLPDLDRRLTRTDVKTPRHAHVDLGISKDACGVAIGHICGHKVETYKNEAGERITEIKPVIAYDVVLRVVPPLGGEIELEMVRRFLRKIRDRYKIPIETVSFDGFQSVDSRQILARAGFKTGYLSVEKVEPWRSFRDALYDDRILLPGHHWLSKELAEVERTVTNNKEKIDHRPNGTKDVADAVVGVAAYLVSRAKNWQPTAYLGGRTGLFMLGDPKKVKSSIENIFKDDDDMDTGTGSNRRSTGRRTIKRRLSLRKTT